MPPSTTLEQQRQQRRYGWLVWTLGAAGTIWFISGYALDRMREARVRATKDRKEKDLLKSHFTSLLSTISFTLYALLPTLSPQLTAAYPVEATSQAIQALSNPVSSQVSVDARSDAEGSTLQSSTASLDGPPSETGARHEQTGGEGSGPTMEGSMMSESTAASSSATDDQAPADPPLSAASEMSFVPITPSGVSVSWASEFERQEQHDDARDVHSLASDAGLDNSPATSVSMSLPPTDLPTDVSSTSGSPPSAMSMSAQLHPSPPRHRPSPPLAPQVLPNKSKKELWADLKLQSLTRTLTTAYLLPLLYILTTSQLATLARARYLEDVKSALPPAPSGSSVSADRRTPSSTRKSTSWLGSFSVEAMGLSEFVDETTSLVPNPVGLLPTAVTRYLPSWVRPAAQAPPMRNDDEEILEQERQWQKEADRGEAERLYLSYSWWLLNEGWRTVASRVEDGVQRAFAGMPLKRELSVVDWDGLIREVRMSVETVDDGAQLFDFTSSILPPVPLPETSSPCPLPVAPPSEHLASLLAQTRTHITSADGRYLLNKGVEAMVKRLLESLQVNLYESYQTKRLVDCLPEINQWGKGVWEGVPDGGVEYLLSLKEFEGFAALVFGDWAPR